MYSFTSIKKTWKNIFLKEPEYLEIKTAKDMQAVRKNT